MRYLVMLGCFLCISAASFAFTGNREKKSKELAPVERVENTQALQLTGSVVDEENKETLAGATISINGKKYYSDLEGKFSIPDVNPGKYEITIELISYKPCTMEIDLSKNRNIHIPLLQQ